MPKEWYHGTWIGSRELDTIFVRMKIDPRGNATIGLCGVGQRPIVEHFRSWRFNDGGVFAGTESQNPEATNSWVRCAGFSSYLILNMNIRGFEREVVMHRETMWQYEFDKLRSSME